MTLPERGIGAGAQELTEYTRIYSVRDVYIRARCYAVPSGATRRYEILVDGFGQYAVIDVPHIADVPRRIEQALDAFATSAELRGSVRSYELT